MIVSKAYWGVDAEALVLYAFIFHSTNNPTTVTHLYIVIKHTLMVNTTYQYDGRVY